MGKNDVILMVSVVTQQQMITLDIFRRILLVKLVMITKIE